MTATFRFNPERVVTVVVGSTQDVWTNELGERVYVDKVELVLEGDSEPIVVADVGSFILPGETVRLGLSVAS